VWLDRYSGGYISLLIIFGTRVHIATGEKLEPFIRAISKQRKGTLPSISKIWTERSLIVLKQKLRINWQRASPT